MRRILHHTGEGRYPCPICNEPVKLETAKTNEDGHPVHEECYLAHISGKVPRKTLPKVPPTPFSKSFGRRMEEVQDDSRRARAHGSAVQGNPNRDRSEEVQ